MGKFVSMRFKRVAEAFDMAPHGYLPENTMNLSDLIDSFIENNENLGYFDRDKRENELEKERELNNECKLRSSSLDLKETLLGLFGLDEENDETKRNIVSETEEACCFIGNVSSPGFKRRLMTRLRERGFDAGICKTKWDKNGPVTAGFYEYIDINLFGTRHIIEAHLAGHFEIARPTNTYSSLLGIFPQIFVGKVEDFKRIVRIMCNAIKLSMTSTNMDLPPWRRFGYMQAKWFGSYKRTIKDLTVKGDIETDDKSAEKGSVGFLPSPAVSYYCRGHSQTKGCFRMGQLAMEMNGNNLLL